MSIIKIGGGSSSAIQIQLTPLGCLYNCPVTGMGSLGVGQTGVYLDGTGTAPDLTGMCHQQWLLEKDIFLIFSFRVGASHHTGAFPEVNKCK